MIRRDTEREGQRGQALVLFAILLVVILGGAGLLVDGGMAWANRRQAQAAADLAVLAAAKAIAEGGSPTDYRLVTPENTGTRRLLLIGSILLSVIVAVSLWQIIN